MTKEQTLDYFVRLINETTGEKYVASDTLILENLSYFIDRYYNTPKWDFMKEEVETLIKKGDLVGLSLYIFKAVQNYRKILYKDLHR